MLDRWLTSARGGGFVRAHFVPFIHCFLFATVVTLTSCGNDESLPGADSATGRDSAAPVDAGADVVAPVDAAGSDDADAPTVDAGAADQTAADAASDVAVPVTLSGSISVGVSVICGGEPANDCAGELVVGAVDQWARPPQGTVLASAVLGVSDLSSGNKVPYQLTGLPGGQTVFVGAWLVEQGPIPATPLPTRGDLISQQQSVTLPAAGAATADVVLERQQ